MVEREVVSRTVFRKNKTNKNWYWHTKALNNEIIADGSEGYNNVDDAIKGFFLAQGIQNYDENHWPDGYEFLGLSDDALQINKLNK
jgi:uncharacterized protein YegP (UPF0339 family)